MNDTYITNTKIDGLLVIERPTFSDERGFFHEVVRFDDLLKVTGTDFYPVQINHSLSLPNVIRALHMEGWNKLVYPVGKMFAAIVDVRPESKTFGKIETFQFEETKHRALFIPKGLANSICNNGAWPLNYIYFVDSYYDGKDTKAIAWNDPYLNINWPIKNPIISERDRHNPTMKELFPDKFK